LQISTANLLIAAQQGARPGGTAQAARYAGTPNTAGGAGKNIPEFEPIAFPTMSIPTAQAAAPQMPMQPQAAGSLLDIIA
jgi:hypothetical protein